MILRDALRAIPRRIQHPLVIGLVVGYSSLSVCSLLLGNGVSTLVPSPLPQKAMFDTLQMAGLITNAFMGSLTWFTLSPLPWQWTGDQRPMASGYRGILQSIPFSLCISSFFLCTAVFLTRPQLNEAANLMPGVGKGLILVASALFNCLFQCALGFAFALWEKRRSEKAEAQQQAEEARWTLLKAQMSPHVLLNSLNGLAELVRDDVDAAIKGMRDLAEIYNQLLTLGEAPMVKLVQERLLLERYLAVEKLRLGERLNVEWNWDTTLDEQMTMPLMLQPLVENAIKHGVAADPRGGLIRISAQRIGSNLNLIVANTGASPMPSPRANPHANTGTSTGVGLRNLKSRLAMAYKGQARFDLVKESPWTKAELNLPMEVQP